MNKGINRNRLADSTSLLAGFGASLCCIGPFVLVALGFGTLAGAVSAFFAPLRPYLLTVAFGIVGARLFMLYRGANTGTACAPANAAGSATETETDGSASCPAPGRGREKALTWGVLGLVAIFAVSPYLLAALPTSAASSTQANATHANTTRAPGAGIVGKGDVCLAIKGMTCSACTTHVEKALLDVPGVTLARVNYADAEACLTVDNPATVDRAALLSAVAAAGYQAEEK